MSQVPQLEPEQTCSACGRFGAYAFDGERLCADCYQQRGSCCAEREDEESGTAVSGKDTPAAPAERLCDPAKPLGEVPAVATVAHPVLDAAPRDAAREAEVHRLNPNCCYQACPRCSSMRRLREFQARHPRDWRDRLRGPVKLILIARHRV